VSAGAYLNTNLKIKTYRFAGASAKKQYITTRSKTNAKQDISILFDNSLESQVELSKEQKKERHQLQKYLNTYETRLKKAIKENKQKSIETCKKKIEDIQAQIKKTDSRANKTCKKEFLEVTLTITNFQKWREKLDRNIFEKIVNNFMKEEFKELKMVSAAAHYDQASPHCHFLIKCNEMSWSEHCRTKYTVADTREAYSAMNNNFHAYLLKRGLKVDEMQTGRKYHALGFYKANGNKEVQAKYSVRDDLSLNINFDDQIHEKEEKMAKNGNSEQINDSFEATKSSRNRNRR
jgi:hypothetical protein